MKKFVVLSPEKYERLLQGLDLKTSSVNDREVLVSPKSTADKDIIQSQSEGGSNDQSISTVSRGHNLSDTSSVILTEQLSQTALGVPPPGEPDLSNTLFGSK